MRPHTSVATPPTQPGTSYLVLAASQPRLLGSMEASRYASLHLYFLPPGRFLIRLRSLFAPGGALLSPAHSPKPHTPLTPLTAHFIRSTYSAHLAHSAHTLNHTLNPHTQPTHLTHIAHSARSTHSALIQHTHAQHTPPHAKKHTRSTHSTLYSTR
jgi:hypothetical protein